MIALESLIPARQWHDEDSVEYSQDRLERGFRVEPITVRLVKSGCCTYCDRWRIVDGHHRVEAHRRAGRTHIKARLSL